MKKVYKDLVLLLSILSSNTVFAQQVIRDENGRITYAYYPTENRDINFSYTPNGFRTGTNAGESTGLPIELLDFNAKKDEGGAIKTIITWTTLNELDNDYFVVEHSTDAQEYTEISRINSKGEGNSSAPQSYETYHDEGDKPKPIIGVNYYRLKQFDINGDSTYYDPVAVTFNARDVEWEIILYPNPAQNSTILIIDNFPQNKPIEIVFINEIGQFLNIPYVEDEVNNDLSYQLTNPKAWIINLENTDIGLYFIKVLIGDDIGVTRLIKQ